MPNELSLSLGGILLGIVGIALQIYVLDGQRKRILVAVTFTTLIVGSVFVGYQSYSYGRIVARVADDIVAVLGNQPRTFEEVYEALFETDVAVANEALDRLVRSQRVAQTIVTLTEENRRADHHRVRVYYATLLN
jgi:hypothetical protein